MSTGAENQDKLYAGHARIAAQLGASYEVYGFSMMQPLDPGNLQLTLPVAVSADTGFNAPLKYNKAAWICYADGNQLGQFNFLVGPYGTFYIADKQPFMPMQAVRCNRMVSIGRGEYSESGPITETVVNFAEGLPIFTQFAREDIQKVATQFGQQLGRAITHWTAFIPGENGMLKQDDIVIDEADGIRYMVDAPDYTNMGYVCHLRLATV